VGVVSELLTERHRNLGSTFGKRQEMSLPRRFQDDPGAHTSSRLVGTGDLSLRVERQVREVDNLPHLVPSLSVWGYLTPSCFA
jgi:hypothetical protein